MKINFYIAMKDGTFQESTGTMLANDFVAHKVVGVGWRLTDYRSGMSIKCGLSSLKECKQAVEDMPMGILQSIKEIRQSDGYKKHCDKLLKYIKDKQKGVE